MMKELDFDKNGDGLLPVIIQDATTLKVLMLGYMNREAYQKSVAEKRVTFFSRTRKTLWTKGETSGNFLDIVNIYNDCDRDTLLITVLPHGATCHTGAVSCFSTPEHEGFIRRLEKVILQRKEDMPQGSYTTHLFQQGINRMTQKVGEEAVETIIEAMDANNGRLIYESSDLIYHLLVLLTYRGISIGELEQELARRHISRS